LTNRSSIMGRLARLPPIECGPAGAQWHGEIGRHIDTISRGVLDTPSSTMLQWACQPDLVASSTAEDQGLRLQFACNEKSPNG
jgi:hypothetical protein